MTTTPVSKVVNVTVSANPVFPSQAGFGLLCIFGISTTLPIGQRIRFYNSLTAVAADFGTAAEEYLAAQVFFAQSPTPATLAIARRFNNNVPAELLGSTAADVKLADYNAIANGSLALTIDGTAVNLSAINLSGAASLSAVAALIQTPLNAAKAGATCIWNGTQFIIRSGTSGITSTIGTATASGVGTDLAPLLALRAADGAIATQGAAAESIATSLNAVNGLNSSWYGFALTKEATTQNLQDAAAFAEASGKLFGYTTADPLAADGTQTTDIGSLMKSANYSRTLGQYDPVDAYAIVSAMARLFATDFTQPDSLPTLKFKLEPGIVPVNISETQRLALIAKNVNYYTYFGTSAMLAEGVTAAGRFVDEVYGLDWLQNFVQTLVFGYLYTAKTKVPQTDKGVARLVQQVEVALAQAVVNGLLAPNYWQGPSVGTKNTGDYLPKGYYVYAQPVAQQAQSDRQARIAPPITAICCGAGAIHSVNITLNFER